MRLHYHPVSTTSRPVVLLVQENNLPVELKLVDLDSLRLLNSGFRWIRPPDPFAG